MNSLFTHRKRKILLLTVNTGKISLFYPQKTVAKYQYRKKKLLQKKQKQDTRKDLKCQYCTHQQTKREKQAFWQ